MKKMVINLVVIISLCLTVILAGCAPSAPAPAPKPTTAAPAPTTAAPAPTTATPTAQPAPAEKPKVTLKFASIHPSNHPYGVIQTRAFKELEAKSNGRIKTEIFWSGGLIKAADMLDGISSGAADIGGSALSNFSGTIPLGVVHQLPGVFDDEEHFLRSTNDPEFSKLHDELLAPFNVFVAKFTYAGFVQLVSKKEVRLPADLKGMNIRVTGKAATDMVKMFGGVPVGQLLMGEIYESLQRNLIQGVLGNTGSVMVNYRLEEVAPYVFMGDFYTSTFNLIMNKGSFDRLTDEDKRLVREAIDNVNAYSTEDTLKLLAPGGKLGKLLDTKLPGGYKYVYYPTPAERREWKVVLDAVTKEYRDSLGDKDKAWFDRFIAFVEKHRQKP